MVHGQLSLMVMTHKITNVDIVNNDLSLKPKLIWLNNIRSKIESAKSLPTRLFSILGKYVTVKSYLIQYTDSITHIKVRYDTDDGNNIIGVLDELAPSKKSGYAEKSASRILNCGIYEVGWDDVGNYGVCSMAFNGKMKLIKLTKKTKNRPAHEFENFIKHCLNEEKNKKK